MRQIFAAIVTALLLSLVLGGASTPNEAPQADASATVKTAMAATGSVSSGLAADLRLGHPTTACTNPEAKFNPAVFPANIGVVTSVDGQRWTVPAPVQEGLLAMDLYNDCNGRGDNRDYASQLRTVVIDEDGVEVTGFIFADNYFELWVNGRFIARDAIAMTPFNSSVVRFKAKYPMTYAIKGVDWETHQGIGMEYDSFNVGDAGLIAYFSDGNGTSAAWRAETFYIAPLDNPSCVRTTGGRDSSFCSQGVRPACAQKDPKTCKAVHFPIPADWTSPHFDDSRWPQAILWLASEVTNQPAYTRYVKVFGDAEFIWTRNLHLDNLVLARYTARGPRK